MSDIKLLPCPFCGGEAELREYFDYEEGMVYGVRCKGYCINQHPYLDRERAIKHWNTRNPMDRIVEQLEQRAEQYRRRGFEAEQKGFSNIADKYYAKQYSYLFAIETVKAGGKNECNTI